MTVNGAKGHSRRTQAERSAATRAALLTSARTLFAEKGYAATGREEIAQAAGVTRGALYHHFANKNDLFRALYEELEREVVERVITAALAAGDPAEELRIGAAAYLDASLDPAVQRVMLLDGPAVLPWDVRQEIMEAYGLKLVREALRATGVEPLEALAHVLLAALHEAALYVARAADQAAAREEVGSAIDLMLGALADR